jgi:DNA-binding SARP family transcriptional activator
MLRLTTLGGLTLGLEDGLVSGAMTQRRRLALLALLATARHRGLSRDKLMAILWPDSDSAHARHALNQLLHLQRKLLPGGELFLGGKTLRLNPAVIRTDVGAFEDALDRGANEEAVALYGGPFLDGFFLRDSRAFEDWVESERDRLTRRYATTCAALAKAAAASGDWTATAEWWRKVGAVDPLDTRIAVEVVHALLETGNTSAALRHAETHVARLREELGVEPDSRLVELMERLRGGGAEPE